MPKNVNAIPMKYMFLKKKLFCSQETNGGITFWLWQLFCTRHFGHSSEILEFDPSFFALLHNSGTIRATVMVQGSKHLRIFRPIRIWIRFERTFTWHCAMHFKTLLAQLRVLFLWQNWAPWLQSIDENWFWWKHAQKFHSHSYSGEHHHHYPFSGTNWSGWAQFCHSSLLLSFITLVLQLLDQVTIHVPLVVIFV